jgi:hypothetical protein
MRETASDLERLQRLLDESIGRASPFLRSSFRMPEYSLSSQELAVRLEGSLTVALATVTGGAELDATQVGLGRQSPRDWSGRGVYLKLEPSSLFTYVRREP